MNTLTQIYKLVGGLILIALTQQATATVVQLQTVIGNIDINLFDKNTPKSVENFLTYAKAGAYSNSVIHRAETGFVIQGGGYTYRGSLPLEAIATNAAIVNEPVYSNKRGTISFAKYSGNVNSATSQWFINLADNSANLDAQNGGFAVFGQVTSEGMLVVDAISALNQVQFKITDTYTSPVPMRNFTQADYTANKVPNGDNFVLVTAIVVKDATLDSAAVISPSPTLNTLASSSGSSSGNQNASGGSGGGALSIPFLTLFLLYCLACFTPRKKVD